MKGNVLSRVAMTLFVTVFLVSVLAVTAFAAEVPACKHENVVNVAAVEATCEEEGNIEYWRCNACKKLFEDKEGTKELKEEEAVISAKGHTEAVDEAVPATCTEAGKTAGKHCSVCGEILVEQKVVPASHIFDEGKVVSPTCSREGYTIYTCKVCGIQVITDKVKPLSHWYAEWQPAGRHQNSAPCKRWGCTYTKTTACVDWDFKLIPADAEETEDYTVCPVCGQLSDGGRLELVEEAKPTPVTAWTPEGDLVLRYGELENGEKIICVGFEYDARLAQYYGICKFTIPAELLEGYQLMLLDADGNETELKVETTGNKASFTIDFHDETGKGWIPVQMLHLVPIEEPATEAVAG